MTWPILVSLCVSVPSCGIAVYFAIQAKRSADRMSR